MTAPTLFRYACLWVPGFAAAALVRQDPALRGRPVAALRGATIRTVVAVTADAAAGGARAGMSATEAATRVPDLVGRMEDPVAERGAAGALLDAAWATSPRIEVVEPGSLCLDLGGLAPLFGDERRIGERLAAAGAAIGLPVRVGIGGDADPGAPRGAGRGGAPGGAPGRRRGVPRPARPRAPRSRAGPRARARALGDRDARRARGAADGGAPRAPRPAGGPAPGARARRGCRAVRAPPRARALPRSDHARLGGAVAPRARLRPRPAPRAARRAPRPPRGRARPRSACRFASPTAACTSTASASPRRSATGGRSAASSWPSWRRSGSRRPVVAVAVEAEPVPLAALQADLFAPPRPSPRELGEILGRLAALVGRGSGGRAGRARYPSPRCARRGAVPRRGAGPTVANHARAACLPARRPGSPARRSSGAGWCPRGRPGWSAAPAGRAASRPRGSGARWWPRRAPGRPRASGGAETAWAREEWDIALPDGVACRLARDCATDAWTVDAVYD